MLHMFIKKFEKIIKVLLVPLSILLFAPLSSANNVGHTDKDQQAFCLSPVNEREVEEFKSGGIWGNAYAGRTSFPRRIHPTGYNIFIFDPRKPAWAAYDYRGHRVRTGIASGGANYCRDLGRSCRTPAGVYTVHRKGSKYCKSNKYPLGKGGAPMPYCMFFKGGYAIHGSPFVPKFNASHGCIRVKPKDAKWLHRHFIGVGTKVIVKSY